MTVGERWIRRFESAAEQLQVVQKRWPDPTPAELEATLGEFPEAGELEHILGYGERPTSSSAVVETTRGPLFVKRHRSGDRPAHAIRIEHAYVDHVRSRGVVAPRYLRTAAGASLLTWGAWVYEVTTAAAGEDRYRGAHTWSPPAVDDAFGTGQALARLHRAATGFDAAARSDVPGFSLFKPSARQVALPDCDFRARWDRWLTGRPETTRYLGERGVDPAVDFARHLRHQALAAPLVVDLPFLWTHNDWHVSNLFWRDHTVSEVIDFGLANRTFALYDLATAIERNAILWLDILAGDDTATRLDIADAIMSGYESVRPLTAAERLALPELLPIVQAEFALSSLEHHLTDGRADLADWSFDVFFHAHTEWFGTPGGAAILDFLRARRWVSPGRGNP